MSPTAARGDGGRGGDEPWRPFMPPTLSWHLDAPGAKTIGWSTTALFLDVAGFTPLTSALQKFGPAGLEELQALLNDYFGVVDATIAAAGGSVIRYEGDAAVAMFPDGAEGAAAAIEVAQQLIVATESFASLDTIAGLQSIRAKIGIARGQAESIALRHGERLRIVVGGEAIDRAARAEQHAKPGQIIVSAEIAELLEGPEDGDVPTEFDDGHIMWAIAPRGAPAEVLDADQSGDTHEPVDHSDVNHTLEIAARLLHPALIGRLELGDGVETDFRIVTIVFVGFSAASTATMAQLDAVMQRVESIAEAADAAVLTVQTGDKGTNTIIAVGAPVSVDDTAARSATIADALLTDDLLECRIGVSTGNHLAGRLGGHQRADYTVLGNAVNMAARLMTRAEFGLALVAENTAVQLADPWALSPPSDLDIKGRVDSLRVRTLRARSADDRSTAPALAGRATLPMVGRADAIATLDLAWANACDGTGGVVHITGEGGVGKTRLVEEFARTTDTEPLGAVFPRYRRAAGLEALVPMFRSLLGLDPDTKPDAAVVGRIVEQAGWDSSRLLYALRLVGAHIDDDVRGTAAATDAEILRALAVDAIRVRAARSPVLLMLDGGEGLDDESRRLLEDVARAAEQLPVLIVSAGRAVDNEHDWPRLGSIIALEPLAAAEAQELAQLAGAESPDQIVDAVGTSPLAIRLAAEAGTANLGKGADRQQQLEQLAAAKIDHAGEAAAKWIREASVFGDIIDREIAELVLGEAADLELTNTGLLTPDLDGASFRFTSDLVQNVAYQGLRPTRRTELHHRAGDTLERFHQRDPDRVTPAAVAHQFANTDDVERKIRAFRRAGQAAADNYALADAVYWFEKLVLLVEGTERCETALALGRWHVILGNFSEAEDAFQIATEDRNGVRAKALAGLAEVMQIDGRRDDSILMLAEAERLARAQVDHDALAAVLLQRVSVTTGERDPEAFDGYVAELHALAALNRPVLRVRADCATGFSRYHRDDQAAEGRRHLQSAMIGAAALDDPLLLAELESDLGAMHYFEGDLSTAIATLSSALDQAKRVGYRRGAARIEYNKGLVEMDLGQVARSLSSFERALEQLEELGDIESRLRILGTIGALVGNIGYLEPAIAIVSSIAQLAEHLDDLIVATDAHYDLGRFQLQGGEIQLAERSQRRSAELAAQFGQGSKILASGILACRILQAQNDSRRALDRLDSLQELATTPELKSSLSYERWRLDKSEANRATARAELASIHEARPTARSSRRLARLDGISDVRRDQDEYHPSIELYLPALARLTRDIEQQAPSALHS